VTFLDSSFKTPRTDVVPQSHFIDAWSTPRVNGHQTPAQTPSFTVFTPVDRRSSSYSQTTRSPEDPGFHVNHFTSSNLPLPPVEPARRLSSSPRPLSATGTEVNMNNYPAGRGRPLSINISQMQTPPPTRDATSRRSMPQHAGNDSATPATPATVIQRTPTQLQASDAFFNQTPFGFQPLQFSPDMVQFPSTAPMSAPPLPHSRLFWDQLNNSSGMDVDMALMSDPFGPTPHRIDGNVNWQTFHTPANQMNPQAFQALHGVSSPDPVSSLVAQAIGAGEPSRSRPNSFIATSEGVDPSMLFSFSSPGPTASFSNHTQSFHNNNVNRQPYETQARVARETLRDRELAKKANGQHSRTNTSSSTASFEVRPGLQRSNTDSGLRKSRPSSIDSKSSGSAAGFNIPRHSSPLKRQSGGSLTAIPEARRARTRLVIDEDGRARTETVPAEDDVQLRRDSSRDSQRDLRQQYPGLYEDDDSETESDEAPVTLSRNSSFNLPPQRRSSKHARQDSDGLERGNSFKVARPSSGIFDKSSFETIRPVKRTADNPFRRFSMMDFSTSFNDTKESEDQYMPDSPGDALGALKKVVVEGRQKRIGMVFWAIVAYLANYPRTCNPEYSHGTQPALGTSIC
jgi:hypothetical protein